MQKKDDFVERNERHIVFTLGFLPLVMVFGNSMLIPILPIIQSSLNLSSFNTSLVLSLFSIPAAITIPLPLVGFLSDRFGRKQIIFYSLLLITIGSILCAISGFIADLDKAFYLLSIGRVVQGIGAGGTTPLAMALVGDLFASQKRGKILGILEVFNGVGKVIAPILGAVLALIVWYVAFFIFPFMSVIALVGMIRFVKEAPSGNDLFSFRTYCIKLVTTFKEEFNWLLPIYMIGGVGLFLLMFYHLFPFILFSITVACSGLGFLLPCINMLVTSKVDDSRRGFVVSLYGTARFLGVALGPIVFNSWMKDIGTMFVIPFYC